MPSVAIFFLIYLLTQVELCKGDYDDVELYSSRDEVTILNSDNFDVNVYNSSVLWLVHFYNPWCAVCKFDASIWKDFAIDVNNWKRVVRVGVLNMVKNQQFCAKYNISDAEPYAYFVPYTTNYTLGATSFLQARNTRESILQEAIVLIYNHKPKFSRPYLFILKKEGVDLVCTKTKGEFLLFITDDANIDIELKYKSICLMLDLSNISWLTTLRTNKYEYPFPSNESLTLVALDKNKNTRRISLPENESRLSMFEAVRTFYANKGYAIDKLSQRVEPNDHHELQESTPVVQTVEQKRMIHTVYQDDLNLALFSSLRYEIASKELIEGDAFSALTNYLAMIEKDIPHLDEGYAGLVRSLSERLSKTSSTTGKEFKTWINKYGRRLVKRHLQWTGCRGTEDRYRGYSCGLWMMFHSITVEEYMYGTSFSLGKDVLHTITDYVKHFYSCQDCAYQFVEMSKTIDTRVVVREDLVLWLWEAHNAINRRLAGDPTEDPAFPKQQFPHADMCPQCRLSDGSWNEKEVFDFLKGMYWKFTA